MAESIGGKIRNSLVAILIGLLVVAFAVWGVNDVFTPQAKNAVLSIGDQNVSTEEFEEAFGRELRNINRQQGSSVTNQQAYGQGLHNRVLQSLLTDKVIAIDSDTLGVGVNRAVARKTVTDIPSFQNELTGEFSEKKLNEVLANNRITREQFENDIFQTLRRQQTVPAIIGGLEAPAGFASQRYNFITEQRKANVLTLNADAVQTPEAPDDDTLKAYVDTNGARYTAPEYRRVVMIRLETFDLTPDLDVTEEELKAAFDYKIELGEIGSPEMRSVVQITATDEAIALKAVEQLENTDPALVASGLGLVEPEYYTDVQADSIFDPETAKAAFEMQDGEARALVGSLGFWYAVKVTAVIPPVVPDFEAAKEELTETLLTEKAAEMLYDITGDIEDAMGDGLTLEEISVRVNVPLSYYDFIDRSGTTRDGIKMSGFSAIPGVAQDDTLLREIFTSDLGFETDLFETGNAGYAAIRVDDIIDSKRRPFEEVKDKAIAAWTQEEIGKKLGDLAADLGSKAQAGETLDALAAEVGTAAKVEEILLVRAQPPETLGPRITAGLLDGEIGDIIRGPGAQLQTRQVAKLLQIIPNQDGLAGQFLDVLQEQATAALSSDLQNAYQQAILREYPLQEYPEKVKSALGITSGE